MNYEIVSIQEKTVAGLTIRTSNHDMAMTESIGKLWHSFFAEGIYHSISNKRSDNSIGLYTNYDSNTHNDYDVMVCCEVTDTRLLPAGIQSQLIPAGKYAKFIVHGNVRQAVAAFWTELWAMNLNRTYSCDFEEYQSGCDMNHAEIHIYISIQ